MSTAPGPLASLRTGADPTPRSEALLLLAACSWAAGMIHAVVAVHHLAEYAPFGAAFVAVALAQGTWGAAVYRAPTRRLLVAGAALNAGIVLVWLASRTTGLPLGPDAGSAEAVGFPDLGAGAAELALVAGALALLLRRGDGPPHVPHALRQAALVVLIFAGVALMAAAPHHG